MTISEFISGFDDYPLYAEYDEQGNVYIYDDTYGSVMAQLESESSVWAMEDDTFTMSPPLLRLMAELADTPPAKRKEQPKYVILNSKPLYYWDYLKIGDDSEYLRAFRTSDPKILAMEAYTLGELEAEKRWLPEKWRDAIDSMLTPLDVALKEGKGNDHMEQDRPSSDLCCDR